MDLADEITYMVHDLEDAVVLGFLDKVDWEKFVHDNKEALEACVPLSLREIKVGIFGENHERKGIIGAIVNAFVTGVSIQKKDIYDSLLLDLKVSLPEELSRLRKRTRIVYSKSSISKYSN